jgi:archaellin
MNTYNITSINGDTIDEIAFTVTINSTPLDLTGAEIVLSAQASAAGQAVISLSEGAGLTITNAAAGQFKVDSQIISAAPGNYDYFIKFKLATGAVKTYISGKWTITWRG